MRQVDGSARRLRRMDELLLPPSGRAGLHRPRYACDATAAFAAGRDCADQLFRPAGPRPFCRGLCRPRVWNYDRAAPAHGSGLHRTIDLYGTRGDRGRHHQFQGSPSGGSHRRRLHDLDCAGRHYPDGHTFYKTQEEFLFASAEAMREEYKAILDAGLILQLDDPALATDWDMINPEPTVDEYKKFAMIQVEALNYALRGLPQDRIRFHLCWGSWHGPHTTDIPMRDIVDLMLAVNVGAYSFEAGTSGRSGE